MSLLILVKLTLLISSFLPFATGNQAGSFSISVIQQTRLNIASSCYPVKHYCTRTLRKKLAANVDWIGIAEKRHSLSCLRIRAPSSVSCFQETLKERHPPFFPVCSRRTRCLNFETGAGRSKGKRGRSSGGRIEGPGHIARQRRNKIDVQKVKKRNVNEVSSSEGPGGKSSVPGKDVAPISSEKATTNNLDPYTRHPDNYYKYGPCGPYGNLTKVVGKPRKGTFADMLAVTFSPVKNMEEFEERARRNAAISYLRILIGFDQSVGAKYFLAFVRQTRNVGLQVPWKEWTLVAHVAVESGEESDKWTLGFRLGPKARDMITQCAAWFRPDLLYVKKPEYQLRLEPVEEFVDALLDLLDPVQDNQRLRCDHENCSDGCNSFYGKFCKLLGLNQNANEEVCSADEILDEERKLSCLEHLFCSNPVELLHPFTRARMEEDRKLSSAKRNEKAIYTPLHGIPKDLSEDAEQDETDGVWSDDESIQESDEDGNEWMLKEDHFLMDEAMKDMDDVEWNEKLNQTFKALSEKEDNGLLDSHRNIYKDTEDDAVVVSECASEPPLKMQ